MDPPRAAVVESVTAGSDAMRFVLVGAFRVLDTDGVERTPRSRKAQAVLAYLALSREGRADRKALAELLWSDRPPSHAGASLRQCLREIKTAFGAAARAVLRADRRTVSLVLHRCDVDVLRAPALAGGPSQIASFLSPLAGCDARFDAWLSDQRALLRDRVARAGTAVEPRPWPTSVDGPRTAIAVSWAPDADPAAIARAGPALWALRAAMARVPWLRVVVSESAPALSYTIRALPSVARGAARLHLELVDEATGRLVWTKTANAARWSEDDEGLWESAAEIEARLRLASRRADRFLDDADVLTQHALRMIHRASRLDDARQLLERALELDPRSAHAHASYAYAQVVRIAQRATSDVEGAKELICYHAQRAVELGPEDGWAWTVRGHVESFTCRRPREAVPYFDRALLLNPGCGPAWATSAICRAYLDDGATALRYARRIQRRRPFVHDQILCGLGRVVSATVAGVHDQAVRDARDMLLDTPHLIAAYIPYLASLGHLGRFEEIEACVERLRQYLPVVSRATFRDLSPVASVRECALGLERAGLARN